MDISDDIITCLYNSLRVYLEYYAALEIPV